MGLFTDGNPDTSGAPRIDEVLEYVTVTYGEWYNKDYFNLFAQLNRIKTTTTAYRYRRCFLTQAAAEAMKDALQAVYDAEGEAYNPPRVVASVRAERVYKCDGYDVIVDYSNSEQVEEVMELSV